MVIMFRYICGEKKTGRYPICMFSNGEGTVRNMSLS